MRPPGPSRIVAHELPTYTVVVIVVVAVYRMSGISIWVSVYNSDCSSSIEREKNEGVKIVV